MKMKVGRVVFSFKLVSATVFLKKLKLEMSPSSNCLIFRISLQRGFVHDMNDAIMSAAMKGVKTQQTTIESELSTLIDEDRGINNSASIMN